MNSWLIFVLLTVVCWGLYGVFLHKGQVAMGDPVGGRHKAFLIVGLAYFLVAVLAPALIMLMQGIQFRFSSGGVWLSLLAGTLGAVGALGVLLAFGAGGKPSVVMSIVFGGAPIVNAFVAVGVAGGFDFSSTRPQFWLGILCAAAGGCLVSFYKPLPAKASVPQPPVAAEVASKPGE